MAVEGPRGWVLHAADAYFNRAEVHASEGGTQTPAPGAVAYERMMAWNPPLARANQRRLRELVASREAPIAVFCTHDPVEYVAMTVWSGRAPERPEAARAA